MNDLKDQFIAALKDAVLSAGSQVELAKQASMHQSRISDYLNGRYEFENMTIGTLLKLFPELKIVYYPEQKQLDNQLEQELEKQVIELFRGLSAEAKARYVVMVSAKFSDKIPAEKKEIQE